MAWTPSPNPGGQNRRLVRNALKEWLDAARVAGIDHVYPGEPTTWQFDAYKRSGSGFACLVGVLLLTDDEARQAYTGPTDPGGKLVHHNVTLEVRHVSYNPDEADAGMAGEDDRDRICDALKDAIRGRGRDLGRPDVVLQVGEYPREGGISATYEPIVIANGSVVRTSTIEFAITQYLQSPGS
jgi:hypothetical protein